MKLVIAYVQEHVADRVLAALHAVPGITGATVFDARGFGRGHVTDRATPEVLFGLGPRLRVEVAIDDSLQSAVVRAIEVTARTGHRGDGKIIVVPVTDAVRISTGETGPGVV